MKIRKFLIQPTALLFLVWMIISDRSGIGAMTLFAALLHEGGHFLASKMMNIPLSGIHIDLLGARLDVCGRMLSYGEEWLLCAAGPLTSLLASAVGALFWKYTGAATFFSCVSFLLGVLNLLPIYSFDGGRMLECFLKRFTTVEITRIVMRGCTFLFLFLLWSSAVYFLLRANDGLSLLCFSMSIFSRFFHFDMRKNEYC